MAISVDPLTYVITIPQSDLTLTSGTLYSYDTDAFRLELKSWEDSAEGIIQPKTHNHNTQITIVGVTYARAIEILAPYSVEFEDAQYTVVLTGSNNNIWDVANGILVQNQVQVIPTNAAGLIVVTQGSGVTEQDKIDIANLSSDSVWDELLSGHLTTGTFGAVVNRLLEDVAYEITSTEVLGETHLTIWTDETHTTPIRTINIGTAEIPKRVDVP